MGANGIETDVQLTKDGVAVLFHDDTLKRVTGAEGSIGDYTFEELQKLRVVNGDFEDKILKLEDFLRHLDNPEDFTTLLENNYVVNKNDFSYISYIRVGE